jgi:hypothetical protein
VDGQVIGAVEFYKVDTSGAGAGVIGGMQMLSSNSTGAETSLTFGTSKTADGNNIERLRIDSSGNVGIGTDSPAAILQLNATAATYTNASTVFFGSTTNNSAHNGIMLSSFGNALGGSVGSNLTYANSDTPSQTNTARSSGEIKFGNTTGSGVTSDIKFGGYVKGSTTFSERVRIDGSGNLLVGKTAINTDSVGFEARAIGLNAMVRDGGETLVLGRNTSDGSILSFRKDGTTVGSIGSEGGDLTIGTGDVGLKFNDGASLISPWDITANAPEDGLFDLGYANGRFKDLYLSGGVHLGGTGSANKLDDYEEGTFTPSFNMSSGSVSYATQEGSYTKVGGVVNVVIAFGLSGISSPSGNLSISGLPFNAGSGEKYVAAMVVALARNFNTEFDNLRGYLNNGGNSITLCINNTTTGHATPNANTLQSSTQLYVSMTYNTDA